MSIRPAGVTSPNQARSCGNRPPRVAFPALPPRPAVPAEVDPDGWLRLVDGLNVATIAGLPIAFASFLWANRLVPVGIALFLFEVGLVATLQAFIFATLSAIYLGGAVAEHH